MKILLFGKDGQVGWELQRSLATLGELVALSTHSADLCGDFTDPAGLAQTVRTVRPDIIVNAAAYTAVDKAESEPELARVVNAQAPGVLAAEAKQCKALLVHYSTDYVFDGSGSSPRDEQAAVGPLNVYGRTKLEGEQLIAASECRHLIFRTSWVYAARGNNFARSMIRLASEREALQIIDDQIGAPTSAELLADVCAHALREVREDADIRETLHCTAAGETSWFAYAQFIFSQARAMGFPLKIQTVDAVSSDAYASLARRPLNSRLDCRRLSDKFGLRLPAWQSGVTRMLHELLD